jgi:hypothetical protein
MLKTYTYAGWSLHKDQWKLRFANDQMRGRHLEKVGHESVLMLQLPTEMTERDAARYLFADTDLMQSAPWRHFDHLGENHPSLVSARERCWYWEFWIETHPEDRY